MAKKSFVVTIRSEWCKACGICMALCPTHILVANHAGTVEMTKQEDCIGCKSCVIHCPDFCFEVKEKNDDK